MKDRIEVDGVLYYSEESANVKKLTILEEQCTSLIEEIKKLKSDIRLLVSSKDFYAKELSSLQVTHFTGEELNIEGVEALYDKENSYLRLVFRMPVQKFNPGDKIRINNLTKYGK